MNPARVASPSRRAGATLVLAAAALVAGCSAAAQPTPSAQPASSPRTEASLAPGPTGGRPSDLPLPTPNLATVDPSAQPNVGEVPPALIAAARTDLAQRIPAVDAATAEVIRAEAVQWPDGSLGCRVPGELYPQVITPGYWIVLSVNGTEYDFRATETGAIRPCNSPLKPNPGG